MTKFRLLELICAAILCGILVAGLSPFHAPANQVRWLQSGNGLRFGGYGTALSAGMLAAGDSQAHSACSIEAWLEPLKTNQASSFFAFYTPTRPELFSLHQELSDLVLRGTVRTEHHQTRKVVLYVPDALRQRKLYFVAVVSNPSRTAVYLNGRLAKASKRFLLAHSHCVGKLVVGNSPVDNTGWRGDVRGLAIYNQQLTAAQIVKHYNSWAKNGRPQIASDEQNVALYLFNEHSGSVVHNAVIPQRQAEPSAQALDLYIPKRYTVIAPAFLERPWDEFRQSWSYFKDILINIIGFIPLGFFFRAYFAERRLKRAAAATIILGGILSITIEMLQSYLPTRSSGLTDVITNTSGTGIGVVLYCLQPIRDVVQGLLNRIIDVVGIQKQI